MYLSILLLTILQSCRTSWNENLAHIINVPVSLLLLLKLYFKY